MKIRITYQKKRDCISFWNWLLFRAWCVNKNGDREWGIGICGIVLYNDLDY